MAETAERLLRLLSLLTVRRSWPGPDLAERVGVTPRTIRRDVERLRSLGYEIQAVPGPAGGYALGPGNGLPPLMLDDESAVAVALGLRAVASGAVTGMEDAAARAVAVIDRVLPDRLRRRVDALQSSVVPLPPGTPSVAADLIGTIALACREGERLRFGYTDGSGVWRRRHVEPYRLVSTGRRWYLVARDLDRSDWRSFRLDRLSDVLPTGVRSRPADPPDAARFVSESVGARAYPFQARLLLSAPASAVAERVPPTTGVVEALDHERCLLITGAYSLDAIALHVAFLGVPFVPLEPPELAGICASLGERLSAAGGGRMS